MKRHFPSRSDNDIAVENHRSTISPLSALLRLPLTYSLIISFGAVTLLPLIFLAYNLYTIAWENSWREINEKHRLLALNMASPISIYIEDRRSSLAQLADLLNSELVTPGDSSQITLLMNNATVHMKHFRNLVLLDSEGRLVAGNVSRQASVALPGQLVNDRTYAASIEQRKGLLSGIQTSLFDGRPTLLMTQPVIDDAGTIIAMLMAELDITLIEGLRKNIHFGEKGHSAIVDQQGRVIAHPNPEWMTSMRDLSNLSIVKEMMAGKTGVTEFYSPFIKKHMVAGFTAVEGIGWGIMVPQPRSEVESHVSQILYTQLGWALIGMMMALLLALTLTRWINAPLKRLASAANQLSESQGREKLPSDVGDAPREIRELGVSLSRLVDGLQNSREEITQLNNELNERVDEATRALRTSNEKLQQLADKDCLTGLFNRRYLENNLAAFLDDPRHDDSVSLIMVDVDYFKGVNDTYGHAAGDAVLIELASLLKQATRKEDLLARYAGDEFVLWLKCVPEVAEGRARELLATVRETPIVWRDTPIGVTISMGLVTVSVENFVDAEEFFHKVDQAMYQAKAGGRNRLQIL